MADLGKFNEADNKLIKWVVAYAMSLGTGTITVHERFAEALKRRHEQGIQQFVYSQIASAKVDTERHILSFTSVGDLSPYITGYFSTAMYKPTGKCGRATA